MQLHQPQNTMHVKFTFFITISLMTFQSQQFRSFRTKNLCVLRVLRPCNENPRLEDGLNAEGLTRLIADN